MTGPAHRFWALHRWWLALGILIANMFYGMMASDGSGGLMGWLVLLIAILILWVPCTVVMVWVPRLRGLFLVTFMGAGVLGRVLEPLDLGVFTIPAMFGLFLALITAGSRLKATLRLVGAVRIARPVAEVAGLVELRPRGQVWNRTVDRIEPHPETAGLLRATTTPPLSKAVPHFDVEVLERGANGSVRWRAIGDSAVWQGSACAIELDADGDATLVSYAEVSRVPLLGCVVAWLDRAGQDAMHELKFFAEGQPNWTIRAGDGRWWPTWAPPPDAAVF
ncbi:MAG: hypothetical protein AAGH68_03900 [Pseudomonadota bacterium]